VFIYATDPMSSAGAKAQLVNRPEIELVGPADRDRARVALVIADAAADDSVARAVRAVKVDGVPNVVLVAARFDEAGVIDAVAAGVTSFVRRAEATSAKLVDVIQEADISGCQLPQGLLNKAAVAQRQWTSEAPEEIDLIEPAGGGGVSTMTSVGLSTREAEVLRLVADGFDTTDIAQQLAYSESTIKGILAKLMARMDARNRCHAIAIAVRAGLI
jgi:DNA-binding NarL/FixJ family response regulator